MINTFKKNMYDMYESVCVCVFISYMQKKMVAKDLLSDVNSACQDLHAGGLTWAKTTVILYLLAKIGQRNQELIRNHLGNFETIGSWLKVLPTY